MDKVPDPDPGSNSDEIDEFEWKRIYAAVIVTTILVIAALWSFSRYFSN
jgi:hypothetical protein